MARLAHDDALEALLQDMRSDPSGQSVREPKKRKKGVPGGCDFHVVVSVLCTETRVTA